MLALRGSAVLSATAAALAIAFTACGGGDGEPAATAEPQTVPTGTAPCSSEEQPTTGTEPEPAPEPAPEPEPEPVAPDLPPSLVGTEWEAIPTRRRVVALTFDCGANAGGVPAIIDALAEAGAPATFFLTGRWVEAFPEQAQAIGGRYPVGNHTYSHPDLTTLSAAEVRTQLQRGGRIIRRGTSLDPRPLFRFPYGARNPETIALVNELGYGSIRWTVDTLGWKGSSAGQSAASVRRRVLAALRPGAIVLMHVGTAPDGSTLDADALPKLISQIRARGYRLVDLAAFVR